MDGLIRTQNYTVSQTLQKVMCFDLVSFLVFFPLLLFITFYSSSCSFHVLNKCFYVSNTFSFALPWISLVLVLLHVGVMLSSVQLFFLVLFCLYFL